MSGGYSSFTPSSKSQAPRPPRVPAIPARPESPTFEQITSAANLCDVFEALARSAGQSPGPDRVRYADYSRADRARLCDLLSQRLHANLYRPGPTRAVSIPKATGGTRTLRLSNIPDRVVASALHQTVSPFLDLRFHPRSHGFRPELGVPTFFAALKRDIVRGGRWVVVTDDVRQAFDSVKTQAAVEAAGRGLDERLRGLIGHVLRGAEGDRRHAGIDQGCALSPTALNAVLHDFHDVPLFDGSGVHGQRYADNVAYACQSVAEAATAHKLAAEMLREVGLKWKGGTAYGLVDLEAGDTLTLLGLRLRRGRNGGLLYEADSSAWTRLAAKFAEAAALEEPAQRVRDTIRGWLDALGPVLTSWSYPEFERVRALAAQHGYTEVDTVGAMTAHAATVVRRWEKIQAEGLRA